MFARLGSHVTLVQRSPELVSGYEPEFGPLVAEAFRREGIDVLTGTRVGPVQGDESEIRVSLEVAGESRVVSAKRLIVALGRRPDIENLDLGAAGVGREHNGARSPSTASCERHRTTSGLPVT